MATARTTALMVKINIAKILDSSGPVQFLRFFRALASQAAVISSLTGWRLGATKDGVPSHRGEVSACALPPHVKPPEWTSVTEAVPRVT
jgi:hypothetical protein